MIQIKSALLLLNESVGGIPEQFFQSDNKAESARRSQSKATFFNDLVARS